MNNANQLNALRTLSLNNRAWASLIDAVVLLVPLVIIDCLMLAYLHSSTEFQGPGASKFAAQLSWTLILFLYYGIYESMKGGAIGLQKRGGVIVKSDGAACDQSTFFFDI